jgi:hypothetical protein
MVSKFEELFPGLGGKEYRLTSPPDRNYNCIAWAAGDCTRWWWPGPEEVTFWPDGAPRVETLDAFRDAFATLGYVVSDSEDEEAGFQKVALFISDKGVPTHAARQVSSGRWTSKLGKLDDIEHGLNDIAGSVYGSVALLLKRPLTPAPTASAAR